MWYFHCYGLGDEDEAIHDVAIVRALLVVSSIHENHDDGDDLVLQEGRRYRRQRQLKRQAPNYQIPSHEVTVVVLEMADRKREPGHVGHSMDVE